MTKQQKIFVVVDPNDEQHVALERVKLTSQLHEVKPFVHVFVAVDNDAVDTRAYNTNLVRDQSWFDEQIRKPLTEAGVEHLIEVCWSSEWQTAVMQAAKTADAHRIYLPARPSTPRRFWFTESKWDLLKGAYCPVVLIRPGAEGARKIVLAAVNFQASREVQKELNREILKAARDISDIYHAELHVVNGYLDLMNYPDRGRLKKETGLPQENIHVDNGYTSEVVSKVAQNIQADLVVMGTLGQNGMTSSRRGNTAERLINSLNTDVMVINYG